MAIVQCSKIFLHAISTFFFQESHIKEVIVYASSIKHIAYCFVAPSRMGQIKCNTASFAMRIDNILHIILST